MPSSSPFSHAPHTFPTRRSSELRQLLPGHQLVRAVHIRDLDRLAATRLGDLDEIDALVRVQVHRVPHADRVPELLLADRHRSLELRSEEHTSELQSPSNLVCRHLPRSPTLRTLSLHDALPSCGSFCPVISSYAPYTSETSTASPPPALAILTRSTLWYVFRSIEYRMPTGYPSFFLPTAIDPSNLDRKSTRLNSSHLLISYAVIFPVLPRSAHFPYTTLFRAAAASARSSARTRRTHPRPRPPRRHPPWRS